MIWNEGQLPDDWTVERLKTKHPSRPFNPDIANCFFRAGLIEAWGRGTIKIIQECRLAKVSLPVFKYDLSGFVIEFGYKNMNHVELTGNENATSIEEEVLALIKVDNKVTIARLVEKIKVSKSTIERCIYKLREENKLRRIGSDKLGFWELLN